MISEVTAEERHLQSRLSWFIAFCLAKEGKKEGRKEGRDNRGKELKEVRTPPRVGRRPSAETKEEKCVGRAIE